MHTNNKNQQSNAIRKKLEDTKHQTLNTTRNIIHSAREWLRPSSEWTSSLTQLSTVMFSPLAAHPVYKSESMMKAIQLMQQQQQKQSSSALMSPTSRDLVLHGKAYAWPSSSVLLQADIPEINNPVSLFQGFASSYPSLAKASRSPKKARQRKRKPSTAIDQDQVPKDLPKSLTQIISEREKRVREYDKISMQKSSTANEIDQINLQINELLNQRKVLEQKWQKLEEKDFELQVIIEDLGEAILDIEEGNSVSGQQLRSERKEDDDEEYEDFDDNEEREIGTCFKILEGHTDDVLCLDFNHPKGMLVSSSMDGTVKAWDLYRKRCLGNIEGHSGVVRCLHLNEARLLTGSDDNTIKQWDLSLIPPPVMPVSSTSSVSSLSAIDGGIVNETFTLEGHQSEVTALDADQHTLLSGSNDKTIRQWDLETQQCVLSLDVMWASKLAGGNLNSTMVDTNLNYGYAAHDFVGALQFWDFALASGTSDGKIRMWDLRTGQAHRTLPGHSAPITCLQFDEVHLVSGSLDKTIRIWDLRTGSVFDTLTYSSPVLSLQFDANKIISAGTTNTIDMYNRTSFQHTTLSGHQNYIDSVRFRNDVLASGGSDNVIKLWSI